MSEIPYLLEMMNGAEGISDIEGKATRVGASERGQRMSFNGADGISDIEGKATREGASERGQRMSFNGACGMSDIEHVAIGNGAFGQSDPAAAGPRWVAASERSRRDASDIDGQNREVEMGGST